MDDETAYKILKLVHADPNISQRHLAEELGVSVGKANYCLKALISKGFIKARNFYKSKNKRGYVYMLTSRGIAEKAQVTIRFLKNKMQEYEALEAEIAQIRREAEQMRKENISLEERGSAE